MRCCFASCFCFSPFEAPETLDVDELRSHGPVLLVADFHAFTFWLLESFENETAASDLAHVSSSAERRVTGLRERGVCLDFVEDGAAGYNGVEEMESKLPEWRSRFAQRQTDRAKLKRFLEGTDSDPKQVHSGPLFVDAVRAGVRKAGARIQLAQREADPECVRVMEERNALAVLGNDTDFVIMKGGSGCFGMCFYVLCMCYDCYSWCRSRALLSLGMSGGRLVTFPNLDPEAAVLPLRRAEEPGMLELSKPWQASSGLAMCGFEQDCVGPY